MEQTNKYIRPRSPRGRPVNIYLTEEFLDKAYEIGEGNVSQGIRIALEAFNKKEDKKPCSTPSQ